MWRASVLTIFPDMFPGPLGASLAGKALAGSLWSLEAADIRAHATDKHRSVDDTPAGGGPGMVMKADVLARAIDTVSAGGDDRPRLLMSPRGAPLTQARVAALAEGPGVVVLCGRFEGIDQRLIEARAFEEISVGDYVLSGGELAAMALIDACVRLLPGVMGKEVSGAEESFSDGLLEYPQYTRPQVFEGRAIPEVLTSGDHARIAAWRRSEAEALTRVRRPDLWAAYQAHLQGGDRTHAIVVADVTGVIRIWSPGAQALFGHDVASAVGQPVDLLVPERHRAAHWAGFRAAIARGRPLYEGAAANIPVLCRDGREVRFPGCFVLVRDPWGQVVGVMAVFAPNDDPRAAERPLENFG
jgi:tRNA (guanine37-N1)-methyltransferase